MIRTDVDSRIQLTTHTLIGKITVEDLLAEIKKFYDTEPTPNNLWNLLEADVSDIESFDIKKLAQFPREYVPSRVGGKTALVSSNDLAYGLSRMYKMYADIAGQKVEIQVFRSLEAAQTWLAD
jgi:acyl CoA:acetate/3-ketoacid CoA transferase